MKKLWIGFPIDGGVILTSPKTGIPTARVTRSNDGVEIAELIGYRTEKEILEEENKKISSQNIIRGMIVAYAIITISFAIISGIRGLTVGLYISLITCVQVHSLLQDILYAFKYKEYAQYMSILERIDECDRDKKDISLEELSVIKYNSKETNIYKISQILLTLIVAIVVLFTENTATITYVITIVTIFILYIFSLKNRKTIKLYEKIEKLLLYRKPTKDQIELVWFGLQFLKKCEEEDSRIFDWYYKN